MSGEQGACDAEPEVTGGRPGSGRGMSGEEGTCDAEPAAAAAGGRPGSGRGMSGEQGACDAEPAVAAAGGRPGSGRAMSGEQGACDAEPAVAGGRPGSEDAAETGDRTGPAASPGRRHSAEDAGREPPASADTGDVAAVPADSGGTPPAGRGEEAAPERQRSESPAGEQVTVIGVSGSPAADGEQIRIISATDSAGEQEPEQTNGISDQASASQQTNGADPAEPPTDASGQPTAIYGIVSPIYKESGGGGGKGLRPLAVRPSPGSAGGGGSPAVPSGDGGPLLSSRQSKCIVCSKVKPIKYMMMANGSSNGNVICSDECLEKCVSNVKSGRLSVLKERTSAPPAAAAAAKPLAVTSVTSLSAPAPAAGSRSRTTCQNAACGRPILATSAGRQLRTVWETLVFCSPSCAVQHQRKDGSACVFCKLELPEMIMGKYCVRFGSDVRQFCSNLCLDGFKKRLKVCSYCQRDITRFQGSFLAPVGSSGSHQFKEFCSQSCLTRYKATHSESSKSPAAWAKCAVCLKNMPVEHKVAVKPDEPVKQLCSQICLKAYKFAIKDEGVLDTCAVCQSLLAVNNMAQFRVWNGSAVTYLCSQSCSNVFVLSNRRIVSCRYCKVKKYNFDMMEVTSEKDGLYCSVHCLKNCGKRITPRREKPPAASCAQCGASVERAAATAGLGPFFCGSQCAQASGNQKAAPSRGTAGGGGDRLPQIQSVISLADEEEGAAEQPERLQPAARDHASLVLLPPPPTAARNVGVQTRPRRPAPQTSAAASQTEEAPAGGGGQVRVLPVPVPMYVPVPMAMYSCPYPVPLAVPVPVPVPLLCGAEDALRLLCGLPAEHSPPAQRPLTEPAAGKRPLSVDSELSGPGGGHSEPASPPHKRHRGSGEEEEEEQEEDEEAPLDLVTLLQTADAGGASPPAGRRTALQSSWCVRVFEQFVQEWNRRPAAAAESDSDAEEAAQQRRLVADPLQATPSELARGLCALTEELRRPGGQPYPADIIHYILLGVQAHLLQHRRRDSLFGGEPYAALAAALERRLPLPGPHRPPAAYVEEQHLWEARVLGAHSPQALLATVVFFVTKHFLLGTLEAHQRLTFAALQESFTLRDRLQQSSLRLLDSHGVYKRSKTYEMPSNTEDPFRCPVRFLEFYRSRCPQAAVSGAGPLYLEPLAAGRPDSAAWFSAEPLPAAALRRLLARLLTARQLRPALLPGGC